MCYKQGTFWNISFLELWDWDNNVHFMRQENWGSWRPCPPVTTLSGSSLVLDHILLTLLCCSFFNTWCPRCVFQARWLKEQQTMALPSLALGCKTCASSWILGSVCLAAGAFTHYCCLLVMCLWAILSHSLAGIFSTHFSYFHSSSVYGPEAVRTLSVFLFISLYMIALGLHCWCGLSLAAASRCYALVSLSGASPCGGFSCCRAWAPGRWASVVAACGLSSCGPRA